VQPWKRLGLLFDEVQEYYRVHQTSTRLTNLKLSMFTNIDRPHSQHPMLNAKGAECKHLAPALLHVCKLLLDKGDALERHIVQGLEGLVELVEIFDLAGPYLSESEYRKALQKANQFLNSYDWLNKWALEQGRLSFHIVVKHHTFIHLVENAKYLNPRFHWCFKSEDFVGKMSRIGGSVAMGVRSTKLSLKLVPKYELLLHFRFTRHSFIDTWDIEDLD
jgi:hypothetical protein